MNAIDQWIDDERILVGCCGGCGRPVRRWEPTQCVRCGLTLCPECARRAPCCHLKPSVREDQSTRRRVP
jgi:hypothetical protein